MPAVACQQIAIDDQDVKEMDGTRTAVRLPLVDVTRLRVRHGLVAERPLLQAILGAVMLGGGGFVTYRIETRRGVRKLGFGKPTTRADVAKFVDDARAAGVDIRVETSLSVR